MSSFTKLITAAVSLDWQINLSSEKNLLTFMLDELTDCMDIVAPDWNHAPFHSLLESFRLHYETINCWCLTDLRFACNYPIQILTLKDSVSDELPEDRQGKMLIHTEYSLLSLLHDQDGVIHHHGLFEVVNLPAKWSCILVSWWSLLLTVPVLCFVQLLLFNMQESVIFIVLLK